MPGHTKTYSIGRGDDCHIRVPDTPGHQDIGWQHADIIWDSTGIVVCAKKSACPVFVGPFRVKRKTVFPEDEIRLGRNFKFKLHYFFVFRDGRLTGLRKRPDDFSQEFNSLEKRWKANRKKQAELRNRFAKRDFLIIAMIVGASLVEYKIKGTRTLMFSMSVVMPLLYMFKEKERKKNRRKIKSENACPKCGEYMDEEWAVLKQKGGHSCGAFWNG
ncbi:MAG TPA: FHA domain-containing protein [Bacteroidetes bacterium]|nr:FHA domain-containing protein [Bacteroidota bacterium]